MPAVQKYTLDTQAYKTFVHPCNIDETEGTFKALNIISQTQAFLQAPPASSPKL
jgi:hypothetical protein